MAIEQDKIQRIQRMEGYLNDYAKTLEETKKAVDALMRRGFSWQDIRRVLYARGCDSEGEPEE